MTIGMNVCFMRIASPLTALACIVVGGFAWARGLYFLAVVDAFLLGVNVMLTWAQWFIFQPRRFK